jgi:hypothetical protein
MDSLELVREFLSPFMSILRKVIMEAWEEYQTTFAKNVHKLTPLAPSVIMSGLVVNLAKKYFDGYNTIEIKKNSHSAIFIFRSPIENFRVELRFKKLDQYYRTRNAKSARNSNFVNQVHEPYLGEAFQPVPQKYININFGFKIAEAWDKIEIWVTCPNGNTSFAWKFKVDETESTLKTIENKAMEPQPIEVTKRIEPVEIPEKQKKTKGVK